MRGGKADITLAVEHKIFFNEAYKQEYERNKVIIAKLDKRKKPLHVQDKLLETDFDKAIVYEAHDQVFSEVITLTKHSSGSSFIKLAVRRGRMSENMMLQVSVICQAAQTGEIQPNEAGVGPSEVTVFTHDLCLFQSEATKLKLAQQIASIIVKVPE